MELILTLFGLTLLLGTIVAVVSGPLALVRTKAVSQRMGFSISNLQARITALSEDLAAAQSRIAELEKARADQSEPVDAIRDTDITDERDATNEGDATSETRDESIQAETTAALESDPAESVGTTQAPTQAPTQDATPTEPAPTLGVLREVINRERERFEHEQTSAADAVEAIVIDTDPETENVEPDETTPSKRLTLEEVLAGKIFVWIGAVALVLTAAFLLKLGFDRNIITEPVRVIAAGVFGLTLWCVGEWARRRVPLIAQVLCGAAVAVLYGAILAGQNYNLYGPHQTAIAFGLMVLVTGAAVILSLRHGPTVAIFGLLGGFMLPPVLAEDFAGPSGGMVLYLLALEIGILAVTGRRGWFGIGLLTLIFTTIWSIAYTLIGSSATDRTLTAMLVIGTAVAYLIQTAKMHRDQQADPRSKRWAIRLAIGAVCSAVAVVALLIPTGGYTPRDLWMLGFISAGVLALARIDRQYRFLPLTLLGLVTIILLTALGSEAIGGQAMTPTVTNAALGFGLLFMLGGYACLWGARDRNLFALLSALAGPILFGVVILANHEAYGLRKYWWPGALMLTAVYALAAIPIYRRRKSEDDGPITIFALVSFAMLCITIVQGVDHPRIAICLALASAVAALVDRRWFIRPLLLAACGVSAIAAVMLVLPGPFTIDIQGIRILNALWPMYLLPALGFGLIAWCATQAGEQRLASWMTWLTVGIVAVMLLMLNRHAFFPENMAKEQFNLYEWATAGCVLMLGGWLGLHLATRFSLDAVRESATIIGTTGAIAAFIGGLTVGNPIIRTETNGGGWLILGLFALYILPMMLITIWSKLIDLRKLEPLRQALRVMPLVLLAVFVGLQIRNSLQASDLHVAAVGMFECATYAIAWMLLGGVIRLLAGNAPSDRPVATTGQAIALVGLAFALLGNIVVLNPLWNEGSVGRWVLVNGLWYLVGPGLIALALLARRFRKQAKPLAARVAGLASVGLGFLLVSLLVRQGFSIDGVLMLDVRPSSGERYAYSLAWVLFGSLLLIGGIVSKLDTLRYGSLAVLLIAVGKVFLIDTASLDNLYRVMSFFGLGVTLIGLGYLYQRLVFQKPR